MRRAYRLSGVQTIPFDARASGCALSLGMLTTLLLGHLPAFCATRGEDQGGRGSLRVLSVIAAAEIATKFVLSAGAGVKPFGRPLR